MTHSAARHRVAAWILVCAALIATAPAGHAEPADDIAAADALYLEGNELRQEQRYSEARAKLEASLAIKRRPRALLNLALCDEALGRTATAWAGLAEAAEMAHDRGDALTEAAVRARMAALEPQLTRLVITVPPATPHGLEVRRDGEIVAPAAYGVGVPVDPGSHAVEARVSGRIAWTTTVVATAAGQLLRVDIPAGDQASPVAQPVDEAVPAATTTPPPTSPVPPPTRPPVARAQSSASPRRGRARSIATWTAAGVGAAGIGVGTYFGLAAASLWNQAAPHCDDRSRCEEVAYDQTRRARRDGWVSTGAFAVGGAALATSLFFYLTRPDERSAPAVRVEPSLTSTGMTVTVEGRF